MSAVRMCDKCGRIFPEGEENSSTGQVTVNVKNDRGHIRPEQKAVDYCGNCTGASSVQPRLTAITGGNRDGSGEALYAEPVVE